MKTRQDTSHARPALLVVFVVVAIVLLTLWARESETGPIHQVRRGVQAVAAPVSAAGEWVTRPVRATTAWVSDLGVSRSDLQELRDQNQELRRLNAELEEARQENERLKGLVAFVEANKLESLGARVIGRPTSAWDGVIVIDRGSADGVKQGMPVIGPAGLLGQTIEVTSRSAKVRLITDQRGRVAAILQKTRAEGIVRGSIDGKLTLDFVSTEVTVTAGDVVITSGMGGVYPKGLVVGEVDTVRREANDLYPYISVRPSAQIEGIEEVLVLVGTPVPLDGGGE